MNSETGKDDGSRQRSNFWDTVLEKDSSFNLGTKETKTGLQNSTKSAGRNSRRRTTMTEGSTFHIHTPLESHHFLPRNTTADDLSNPSAGNSSFGSNRIGSNVFQSSTSHFERAGGASSAGIYLSSSERSGAPPYLSSSQQISVASRKDAPCPHCSAHFKRKYDLLQHISAVHEKNRPFRCDACDTSFAHKGTLSKHVRTVHRRERPYACEHCGQKFSERGNVNKHKQRSNKCRIAELNLGGRSGSQRPATSSQFSLRQSPQQWWLTL